MVLCVKYRKWLVRGELPSFLLEVLRGIEERYEFVLDTVGCDDNHEHVFVGAVPGCAPSRVMQVLKSVSDHMLFERFRSFGERYGVLSSGVTGDTWDGRRRHTAGITRAYVENQGTPEEKEDYAQLKLTTFTS